jgi:predicted glycosyltransferase
MKIIFDICHPCDINFFKNTLYKIRNDNTVEIYLIALNRKPIPQILNSELSNFNIKYIGKHRRTFFSIIFEANILRFFQVLFYAMKLKPDIGLSFGSFILGTSLKLLGKRNIQFDDDPERIINVLLEKLTSTELYFPPIIQETKRIKHFKALKEWAYLSPEYFKPDKNILTKYGLNKSEYIFIREISSGSLNYNKQEGGLISLFANQLPKKYKVIFSLEEKSDRKLYPNEWIDLIEPVDDIHSLIYFSKYLISSGDSMAREGGILGIPSIYCGIRDMKANQLLMAKNILFKKSIDGVIEFIKKLDNGEQYFPTQDNLRSELADEWVDVTSFILGRINHYKRDNK